jgi:hypothetical protein
MKSKAKPAKGSARTKRFDVGGTVGALAGLGTLAYLMSRKKKGEDGKAEYKPQGKFPSEDGSGTSGSGDTTTKVDDAGRQRALDQSKDPRLNYMPDDSDRKELYSDINAKRTDGGKTAPVVKDNKPKPRLTPKAQVGNSTSTSQQNKNQNRQGIASTTGVDAGIAAGNKKRVATTSRITPDTGKDNDARPSRPYPAQEAAARKAANEKKPGDNTFITKERSEAANASVGRARREQAAALGNSVKEFFTGKPASGRGVRKTDADKKMASGGKVKSASARADGCAIRGKTRA